jgi:hypothetical protein
VQLLAGRRKLKPGEHIFSKKKNMGGTSKTSCARMVLWRAFQTHNPQILRRHRKKFSRPCGLPYGICAPLVKTTGRRQCPHGWCKLRERWARRPWQAVHSLRHLRHSETFHELIGLAGTADQDNPSPCHQFFSSIFSFHLRLGPPCVLPIRFFYLDT